MKLTEEKLAKIHDFLTKLGYTKVTDILYGPELEKTVKTNCPLYVEYLLSDVTTEFVYEITNFPFFTNDIWILEYFYTNYVGKHSPENCDVRDGYVELKYVGERTIDTQTIESTIFSYRIAHQGGNYQADEYVNFCQITQEGDNSCSPLNRRKFWSYNIIVLMPNDSGFIKFNNLSFPVLAIGKGAYDKLKLRVKLRVEVAPELSTWYVRQIFGFERIIIYRLDPISQITMLSLLLTILSFIRV